VEAAPSQRLTVLRAIDKLDRLGLDAVEALLGSGRRDESGDFTPGANLSDRGISFVIEYLRCAEGDPRDTLGRIQDLVLTNDKVDSARLRDVYRELNVLDVVLGVGADQAQFDPAIVRGLEYYTGPVYEIELLGETKDEDGKPVRIGSVGAGGRYDDLVARFRGERIPATGISIGVSRLAAALAMADAEEDGPIVILALEQDQMAEYFALARALRAGTDHPVEVYLGAGRFGAQLKYADKRNAPLAIIIGEDERKAGQATIKDLKLGARMAKTIADNEEWRKGRPAQITVPRADLAETVLRMLRETEGEAR
jgi:histidyl-tRNA synthetase